VVENGWGVVREYKGLYEFAENEEDNVKMVNLDRSAGVKRRVETTLRGAKRLSGGFRQLAPTWGGYQQAMLPAPTLIPPPQMMPPSQTMLLVRTSKAS